MVTIKGDVEILDPRLDRIYQEDWRSLNYSVTKRLEAVPPGYPSRSWAIDVWLDQGKEGACVGFGFSHELRADPQVVNGITNQYAREHVYWEAQKIDDQPGGSYPGANPVYEGTSVLAGAKVLTNAGFYSAYHWALSLEEMALGVGKVGPAVIGVNWYNNMFNVDRGGFIHPSGGIAGGHCILVRGVNVIERPMQTHHTWAQIDQRKSYFTLHNSWGQSWGVNGEAKITFADMQKLLNAQGDVCFPTRTSKLSV